ncbi:hypothetical protein vBLinoVEfB7_017 [Listeria phage vB_Lino_VEfB7]|nr:hypothetical protein vBLinoVEfB7_017 [Listeria phage vB_Lino_VEfB7]
MKDGRSWEEVLSETPIQLMEKAKVATFRGTLRQYSDDILEYLVATRVPMLRDTRVTLLWGQEFYTVLNGYCIKVDIFNLAEEYGFGIKIPKKGLPPWLLELYTSAFGDFLASKGIPKVSTKEGRTFGYSSSVVDNRVVVAIVDYTKSHENRDTEEVYSVLDFEKLVSEALGRGSGD